MRFLALLLIASTAAAQGFQFSDPAFIGQGATVGVAAPWKPTTETGLKLWLTSTNTAFKDAGTTLCVNNDTCQQWNDGSGNGNNFSQATTANKFTYLTSVQNGLPALIGNGTSSFMTDNAFSMASGSRTVFLAVSNNLVDTEYVFDSSTGRFIVFTSGDTHQAGWYDGVNFQEHPATSGWHTYIFVLNAGAASQSYFDGVSQGDLTYTSVAIGTASAVGGRYDGTASWFKGAMGDIGIYDHAISGATVTLLQSYLKTKWGTP